MRQIIHAAAILRSGGLVAFPTETVYGLGADATNGAAVRKIFAAKGRPITNPLICHVPDADVARRYAAEWPLAASQLAERFWPGPLTLVLPKTEKIVPEATAGLNTVGLRAPDHPLTLQLLRVVDVPIAGPSANTSTHVSPTLPQHVRDDLGDAVDMILDGGRCAVGIESTVLDLSRARPTILRLGGVSRQQIEAVIGPVDVFSGSVSTLDPALSPGQQEVHYAPRVPAYRFDRSQLARVLIVARHPQQRPPAILVIEPFPPEAAGLKFNGAGVMPSMPAAYAQSLYGMLREMEKFNPSRIYVEMPPDAPEWAAVRDRLLRATRPMP